MKQGQSPKWKLPPTARQCLALVRQGVQDKDLPATRWEARRMLYELKKKGDNSHAVQNQEDV